MNSYELSRAWYDFCFVNPEKIKPLHSAIYFFAIEHCNRLGWKDKFGFPSQMVMEAIGVKNWRTYSAGLNDLIDWGFIKMVEISKNQYSANIIALVKYTKATTKALDKALQKHSTKQGQSTVSIDKQYNKEQYNKEQYNNKTIEFSDFWDSFHSITKQSKTDKEPALKYWKKLTDTEKKKAIDSIQLYYDNLKDYGKGKMSKKARTYLSDKNFNDEYDLNHGSGKTISLPSSENRADYDSMMKKDWQYGR